MSNDQLTPEAAAYFERLNAERAAWRAALPEIRAEGEAALRRLLPIAQSDTGQSGVIARFLLGLFNGDRFAFDLTEFRRLDRALFDDCLTVLRMDYAPLQEVHCYFPNGGQVFEKLATDWGWNTAD